MTDLLLSVWAEPAPPRPPARGWRDWALVGVLGPLAALEGVLRPGLPWRVVTVLLVIALLPALLWRRTRPLLAVCLAFGALAVLSLASAGAAPQSYTGAWVLLLPYALYRWGSGRDLVLGTAVIVAKGLVTGFSPAGGLANTLSGLAVLGAVMALGAALRYRSRSRQRELGQVQALERERLARDLHDTVAHHVSAIAIRAQAGLAMATTDPAAATEALRVIEAEASRTLTEMRDLVRVLRRADQSADQFAGQDAGQNPGRSVTQEAALLAPAPQIPDLAGLAGPGSPGADGPAVAVEITGDLAGLPPSVGSAIYRLAQESITNARRHARHATRIDVQVAADDRSVRLRVQDDGDPNPLRQNVTAGFGLIGMTERARLLGGSCQAGPADAGRGLDRHRGPAPEPGRVRGRFVSVRVLVADDQEIVRTGLRMILDAQPGIEVVGEAADGLEAVELARRLRPDVCLLDIRMPRLDGIEATRRLAGPDVADPLAVVVITTFDLDEYVYAALRAGARGFLLKDAGPVLLAQAVHAAAEGDALIAPSVTARLLATFAGAAPSARPAQPIDPLTDREEQVLAAVARGLTNHEIAGELYITLSTVKTHVASLMAKLGVRNRVEVAIWAWETGRAR